MSCARPEPEFVQARTKLAEDRELPIEKNTTEEHLESPCQRTRCHAAFFHIRTNPPAGTTAFESLVNAP